MWLPTQGQVSTAGRYATAVAGTAITIFGLQAKGFSLDQAKEIIQALGATVNNIVILLAALAPVYALLKGVHSSSPIEQAKSVEANGAVVVASPEIAAATPNSPNIVSSADVKVVNK
jgi:hypothetical protein